MIVTLLFVFSLLPAAVLRLSVLPQSTTVIERTLVQYMCRVDCYPGGANRCPMFPQWSREAGEPLPPQATVCISLWTCLC